MQWMPKSKMCMNVMYKNDLNTTNIYTKYNIIAMFNMNSINYRMCITDNTFRLC